IGAVEKLVGAIEQQVDGLSIPAGKPGQSVDPQFKAHRLAFLAWPDWQIMEPGSQCHHGRWPILKTYNKTTLDRSNHGTTCSPVLSPLPPPFPHLAAPLHSRVLPRAKSLCCAQRGIDFASSPSS